MKFVLKSSNLSFSKIWASDQNRNDDAKRWQIDSHTVGDLKRIRVDLQCSAQLCLFLTDENIPNRSERTEVAATENGLHASLVRLEGPRVFSQYVAGAKHICCLRHFVNVQLNLHWNSCALSSYYIVLLCVVWT